MVERAIFGIGLAGWFVVLAAIELVAARRGARRECSSDARLVTNFGLGALVLACASLVPVTKVASSAFSQSLGIGLSPNLGLPWIGAFSALLLADGFAAYWTHRLMHAVPLLWRIHRVHHADSVVDISTSLRNHPLELLVTVPTSAAVVMIIGASPAVVAAAQTLVAAASIWQHADLDLPTWLERRLRKVVITPAFHRLHHSPDRCLHDGNYGDLITLWDRLFGTASRPEGRRRVGLDGQVAHPDQLLAQIWSPINSVEPALTVNAGSLQRRT